MSLLQELQRVVDEAGGKSGHLVASPSLKQVLDYIDSISENLKFLKGKTEPTNAFLAWGVFIKEQEDRSAKEDAFPWRFVFDIPMVNGIYVGDPVIQICSGEPDYHRFVMTFTPNGVQVKYDIACIDPNPDLSEVSTSSFVQSSENSVELVEGYMLKITLHTRKQQDEDSGIQRIAILGAARVFIHGEQAQAEHQKLIKHVQEQCNRFLDVFEDADGRGARADEPNGPFRTVNGGWAGKLEGSTGLPLISNLIGNTVDPKYKRGPVTVMPSGGAYDHVDGVGQSNYFEVAGTWGDDSKYLIGFSSAAIIFEPYGFWTGIELKNAVAQGKPTVVIRGPERSFEPMKEKEISLPGGKKGIYREYSDLAEAAVWIKRCLNMAFINKFVQEYSISKDLTDNLEILKSTYVDGQIGFKVLIERSIKVLPDQLKRVFKLAMVKQHGEMIKLLSDEDRRDKELAIIAVRQNPDAINAISPKIAKNVEIRRLANIPWTPTRIVECNKLLNKEMEMLKERLTTYKDQCDLNKNEYHYYGLFRYFGAYSKTEKFAAMAALLACIQDGTQKNLSKNHATILRQGRLGQLIKKWENETGRTIDIFVEKYNHRSQPDIPKAPIIY